MLDSTEIRKIKGKVNHNLKKKRSDFSIDKDIVLIETYRGWNVFLVNSAERQEDGTATILIYVNKDNSVYKIKNVWIESWNLYNAITEYLNNTVYFHSEILKNLRERNAYYATKKVAADYIYNNFSFTTYEKYKIVKVPDNGFYIIAKDNKFTADSIAYDSIKQAITAITAYEILKLS